MAEGAALRRHPAEGRIEALATRDAPRTAAPALAFTLALAVVVVGPPLLSAPFIVYPLFTVGMVLDLFTPVVLVPTAWWLFRAASGGHPTGVRTLLFIILMAVLLEGQAMHLAANAIGEQLGDRRGDAEALTHLLDETLSHFLWHGALVGLTVVLWTRPAPPQDEPTGSSMASAGKLAAAAVFGTTFFLMVVEGGTGVLGVPAAVVLAIVGIWLIRSSALRRGPAVVFVGGYALATLLFVAWAGMNGWTLPQFSEVDLL